MRIRGEKHEDGDLQIPSSPPACRHKEPFDRAGIPATFLSLLGTSCDSWGGCGVGGRAIRDLGTLMLTLTAAQAQGDLPALHLVLSELLEPLDRSRDEPDFGLSWPLGTPYFLHTSESLSLLRLGPQKGFVHIDALGHGDPRPGVRLIRTPEGHGANPRGAGFKQTLPG